MNAQNIIILAEIISNIISTGKSSEKIDILGNLYSTIGQNLSTIALLNETCENKEFL